jgi:hypothetical protein
MNRRLWTFLWIVILIASGFFRQLPTCKAQNTLDGAEYDYHALAITTISNSAREASKLNDISQRVEILLYAAKILVPFQQNEATRLLDILCLISSSGLPPKTLASTTYILHQHYVMTFWPFMLR